MADAVVVNKTELVQLVAKEVDVTQKMAAAMMSSLIDNIAKTLETGNTVKIAGLGTFRVVQRAARNGVNPKTGEKITIPAVNTPAFKFTSSLKDNVREALPVAAKKGKKATK